MTGFVPATRVADRRTSMRRSSSPLLRIVSLATLWAALSASAVAGAQFAADFEKQWIAPRAVGPERITSPVIIRDDNGHRRIGFGENLARA